MMAATSFWHEKRVFITGGSSGIGAALARHLAARGAAVGLIARREEPLAAVTAALREAGHLAAHAVADVTQAPRLREAVTRLRQALGRCDIAIANAGIHRYTPGYRFHADDVATVFATNVQGAANLYDAVLPEMLERQSGHLAAVASIAGMVGLPDVGAYSASKSALITLTESLRVDLASSGIRVTTVCPGFVDTPFIASHDRRVLRFLLTPEQAADKIARAIAAGKHVTYFPWPTWLTASIARRLPFSLYRRLASRVPKAHELDPPPQA